MSASTVALLATLEIAVPLHIHHLQQQPEPVRQRWLRVWARNAVDPVTAHGDVLQYGGRRGEAAAVFNHLARGLAALAHCPGGVTFAGRHWCVDHHTCTTATVTAAAAEPALDDARQQVTTINPGAFL